MVHWLQKKNFAVFFFLENNAKMLMSHPALVYTHISSVPSHMCRPLAKQEFFTKPKFSHLIDPEDCLSASCDVICMDMYTLQVTDLEVQCCVCFIS